MQKQKSRANRRSEMSFRAARLEDISTLLTFIHLLAAHEGRPSAVTATEVGLADLFFGDRAIAHGFLGFLSGQPVAYAITAEKFSSFRAKRILYVEDILVKDEARGCGFGHFMMQQLARVALERNCVAMEWSALSNNIIAKDFYARLGADLETGKVHFSFDNKDLQNIVGTKGAV